MKTLFISFISVVVIQLFIPLKIVYDKEISKLYGQEFKFKTQPIDPYDPFRGKYVTLNFSNNNFYVNRDEKWKRGEEVFVVFKKDKDGYAEISRINKKQPKTTEFYLKTEVNYVERGQKSKVVVAYPFTRYYMEESKAGEAEKLTMRFDRKKLQTISATVNVYRGEFTVTGLMLNDEQMEDAVVSRRSNAHH